MHAWQDIRHHRYVHHEMVTDGSGDVGRSRFVGMREELAPAFRIPRVTSPARIDDGAGHQLATRVSRESGGPVARGNAVALCVHREDGGLQTIEDLAQTRLSSSSGV